MAGVMLLCCCNYSAEN